MTSIVCLITLLSLYGSSVTPWLFSRLFPLYGYCLFLDSTKTSLSASLFFLVLSVQSSTCCVVFSQGQTFHLWKYAFFLFSCVSITWRCIHGGHFSAFKPFHFRHFWHFWVSSCWLIFLLLLGLIKFDWQVLCISTVCCWVFGPLSFVLCCQGCISFP